MKIAQFIDTFDVGGAETMLLRLSQSLMQNGHEVVVLHFGSDYLAAQCEQLGLAHQLVPFHKDYSSIVTVSQFSIKFARYLKQHRFDVLHSHLYGPISGSFLGAGLNGITHIGTLHDVYLVQERIGRGCLLRAAQALGTQLVTVSEDMRRFYQNYIPLCKPLTNIPNGIAPQGIDNSSDVLQELDPERSFRLVTVGRLIPLKGQGSQIAALANVLRELNIKLFLVGDGPDRDLLSRQIDELNLSDNIFLLGSRNDVSHILLNCDGFILASESEGLSCSIIEAMAAGLPCIVSNVGGNAELIEHQHNGFVFERSEWHRLSDYVKRLYNNADLRRKMGSQSKLKAQQQFSIDAMVAAYQSLYRKLN